MDSWRKVGLNVAKSLPKLIGLKRLASLLSASSNPALIGIMHSLSMDPLEPVYLSHYSSSVGPWTFLCCFANTKLCCVLSCPLSIPVAILLFASSGLTFRLCLQGTSA